MPESSPAAERLTLEGLSAMGIEDTFIVTRDGAERLTPSPQALCVEGL
jgi:Xaa-Pro aminopeptidase